LAIRKKYIKIIAGIIGILVLTIVTSVIYEEYSASYGMGKKIITARPFNAYVSLTRWQVKSGRAYEYIESIKLKNHVEEIYGKVRLYTYIPIFTVNNYSLGDGLWWAAYDGADADVVLNIYMTNNLSDEALKGVIAHELGHFVKGHLWDRRLYGNESEKMELQNEADEWAVDVVGKNAVIAYHKETKRFSRRISNLTAH